MVANPVTGPKTIKELVARSKAQPEGVSYGSTGVNTGQHLTMELFKKATGANLMHIPYRGSAPAVVDLLAGQIPVGGGRHHVGLSANRGRAGCIALGVGEIKRSPRRRKSRPSRKAACRASAAPVDSSACSRRAARPQPVVQEDIGRGRKVSQDARRAGQCAQSDRAVAYEDGPTFAANLDAEAAKWKTVLSR